MNITAKFHCSVIVLQVRFKCTDGPWNACLFTSRGAKITLLSVRSNSYTRRPLPDKKAFISESPVFNSQDNRMSFRIYCCIVCKYSLLRHYHWLPDTSHLFHAAECTVNWRNTVCTTNSSFILNVWTQCNSEIIQSSMQFDADSHSTINRKNSCPCSLTNVCTTAQYIYI
jgi:hypothetical protein